MGQENITLRDEIMLQHGHEEIVGRSAAMKQALARIEQAAGTHGTVLLPTLPLVSHAK